MFVESVDSALSRDSGYKGYSDWTRGDNDGENELQSLGCSLLYDKGSRNCAPASRLSTNSLALLPLNYEVNRVRT